MADCIIPEGYKKTSLGVIPKEWEIKRLGDICSYFKSGECITSKDISKKGEYPVYGGNGLRGYTNKKYTHDGAYILIGRQGALCGNINYVIGKCYISEHAIAVQTQNNLLWLRYKLDFWNLNRYSESSAQPGLSVEKLTRYKLALPPLEEQRKIAEVLSVWDKAIEKQMQLVEKLELRKKGLMQQLLTGKKRLPGFSGEWKKVKAGLLFGSSSIRSNKLEPLLSVTQDKGVVPRDMLETRVTMPNGDLSSFKLVDVGDFVISLRSFEGGLEYSKYRGIVSPAYTVLKKKTDLSDVFYKVYFKSNDFIQRLAVAVIGIRDGKQISYSDFCYIKIPYPSLQEQNAIANVFVSCDNEILLAKHKLNSFQQQKKGLMQVLLTGKKRVTQ